MKFGARQYVLKTNVNGTSYTKVCSIKESVKPYVNLKDVYWDWLLTLHSFDNLEEVFNKSIYGSNYYWK